MKCLNCGTCCKYIFYPALPKGDTLKFFITRGAIVFKDCLAIPFRCQHLDKNNKCKIYSDRPDYCKYWNCKNFIRHAQIVKLRGKNI